MAEKESQVTIHLPSLVDAEAMARLGAGAAGLALVAAARIARARWIALAHDRLRGQGRDLAAYVAAIGLPVLEGDRVTIRLTGDAAGRIEEGRERIDLRDVLLGDSVPLLARGQMGRGKRQNKAGGYYRAIPLPPRGGSPEAASAPPGAAGDAALAQDLATAARSLAGAFGTGGQGKAGGGSGGFIASNLPLAAPGSAGLTSDPMARLYSQPGGAPQARGGPVDFRTISTSKPTGWIVRPKPGTHIMRDLEKVLAKDVPAAIDKMLLEIKLPGAEHGI